MQAAAMEWTRQGVALLTAGITWDAVRVSYDVLAPGFDRDTAADALRRRLDELELSGAIFCDPYRPCMYLMVPPGTDREWPRALAPEGVECLGGTRPYIHHVGVPRLDRATPPGPFWLMPPDSIGRRHLDPRQLHQVLHECAAEPEQVAPSAP
jgi:hypothetical protein